MLLLSISSMWVVVMFPYFYSGTYGEEKAISEIVHINGAYKFVFSLGMFCTGAFFMLSVTSNQSFQDGSHLVKFGFAIGGISYAASGLISELVHLKTHRILIKLAVGLLLASSLVYNLEVLPKSDTLAFGMVIMVINILGVLYFYAFKKATHLAEV